MTPAELVASLIDEILSNGDFSIAEAGREIAERMRTQFPEEHLAFLDQEAGPFYGFLLGKVLHSRRGSSGLNRSKSRFTDALGDPERLSVFTRWRCRIDDENHQRAIGDMTGADHLFVASDYAARSSSNGMIAAFHAELAKKVGKKRTSEVISEEKLLELYRSITGRTSPVAA